MTGPQYATVKFHEATTDEQRIERFSTRPSYYEDVKVQLQELMDEKWDDWMADRPEWLTDNVIASIPDDYLPKPEVKRLEVEGRGGEVQRFWGMERGAKLQPGENAASHKPHQPA